MSDGAGGAPAAMEMVPLADRLRWMLSVRIGVVALPVVAWVVVTGARGHRSVAELVVPGVLLVLVGLLMQRRSRHGRRWAVAALTVPVTLDGVYLGWALYLTGGVTGPVVYVIALHVLAVTLLGSFRTGMKVAVWHSLVVMSVLEAVSTRVLPDLGAGTEFDKLRYGIFLAVVWVTAVTTAVLAAVNERELRRRRYDEAILRRLAAALHEAETGVEVVEALLTFTLDAADSPLAAVHCRMATDDDTSSLVARMHAGEAVELLREVPEPEAGSLIDTVAAGDGTVLAAMRGADAWVDEVLDGASRVVAVPFGMDGQGTGVLAFQNDARDGSRIQQRRVAVVEQAVAHAATALARVALLEHLQQNALTDGLTGVANRRAFDVALVREVAHAGRTDSSLAVIILDLDKFKSLNDTYGHLAGDDVLRAVGAALRTCTRQSDLVARYGGEEFILLLPGGTEDDAVAAAQRVREALLGVEGPRAITASLGIACLPAHGATGAELLAAADAALYEAKTGGRDQARVSGREGPVTGGDIDVRLVDPRLVAVPAPRGGSGIG